MQPPSWDGAAYFFSVEIRRRAGGMGAGMPNAFFF